jgi:hypothetical protein
MSLEKTLIFEISLPHSDTYLALVKNHAISLFPDMPCYNDKKYSSNVLNITKLKLNKGKKQMNLLSL